MLPRGERIAEFPVTEWRGVGITIRIDHPDAKDSMSYRTVEDSRLMPLHRIRRPLDTADHWQVIEYGRAMDERQKHVQMLADKLAAAIIHALERTDP